ncbi:MAG: DMT family transporter [SAR202 cluster bacterium]|nr:DMT family transporter [SAR202 cluster bacterium]|tara:strand:- start:4867 stop:5751 length:885 start_codon:yes stop_codon:yes gene_type:complete
MPAYSVLITGLISISSASVLIRLAEAPIVIIAASRLTIAALIVGPPSLGIYRKDLPKLSWPFFMTCVVAGAFLAFHFLFWIASLNLTSVLSSAVFVTSHPILIAFLGPVFIRRETFSWRVCIYALLAVLGAAILTIGDAAKLGQALFGDMLAFLGAVMMSGYLLVGRRLTKHIPLPLYLTIVYSSASIILIGLVVTLDAPVFGYTNNTYLYLLSIAIFPQVIGHSLINWALRRWSAIFVSVTIVSEPVIASILAAVFLGEVPSLIAVFGGIIILTAIYLTGAFETRNQRKHFLE